MSQQPVPPTYDQSEGFGNAHYMGPNPTYPNADNTYNQKPMGPPYPTTEPQQFQTQMQPQTTYVQGVQYPGTSVHMVTPTVIRPAVPIIVPTMMVGPYPTTMVCPECRESVTTVVTTQSGLLAWLACGGLCLLGCWFGCCLIPFCMDSCKDSYHHCPRCNRFLGKHSKLS